MADEIYMHRMGMVDLRGLNMEITFLRGLLDTLSIVPEVIRVSPYKPYADPLLNRNMSDEMRENYTQLSKEGVNLFSANDNHKPYEPEMYMVLQRHLEGSNVNSVDEMVELISLQRNFESTQKAVRTLDDALGKAANDIGRYR